MDLKKLRQTFLNYERFDEAYSISIYLHNYSFLNTEFMMNRPNSYD